jgi:GNAT superfamily N-acetyltransferase
MITYHLTSWADFIAEAKPLLPLHWEELALNKDKVPLDPQYDVYAERERLGQTLIITVRVDSQLVGYFIGFVNPGLHYKTCLTCIMDIFYIHPDHRGSGMGFTLFKEVERECKRRGVQRLFVGSKLHKDVSYLFEKLGYEEVERYYSAWLGA